MNFTSPAFLFAFLPLCTVLYYVVPPSARAVRNAILLAASFLFYGIGEPSFVIVLALSVVINWVFGLFVAPGKRHRKSVLAFGLAGNVLLLFRFKYAAFAISQLNAAIGSQLVVPNIVLPLGISFFTFQSMSYLVDVYRGNAAVRRNPFEVALYVAFFPQLVAGPIVRYETVASEISGRRETLLDFSEGLNRFVEGLAKKVLLANPMGTLADAAFDGTNLYPTYFGAHGVPPVLAWLGAIAYTFQIYFDFSGYSDMAIGLGRMFGFHFLENFRHPYVSFSVSEFWRRWHISMGTWFRDYVYFPLGGSRVKTKFRLTANLFTVWILTGLWHGANWTFVVWGIMYFALIALEKCVGSTQRLYLTAIGRTAGIFYTMFFVLIGWVVFRSPSLSSAKVYLASMFGLTEGNWNDPRSAFLLRENLSVFMLASVFATPLPLFLRAFLVRRANLQPTWRPIISVLKEIWHPILFVCSLSCVAKGMHNPFIF